MNTVIVRAERQEQRVPRIRVEGARAHNLDALELVFEHGCWHAVVGVSGSGKTSLVQDTLVAESQRPFLGALSPRARQALGKARRAEVDALDGLPPAIAVGHRQTTEHVRSTVGTLTGLLDLLRLVFARQATDPGGETLSRSTFSFNASGACEACGGLGEEDRVDPELFVADPTKSLRDGALVPTLKSGYTVYSQVTLEVMDTICRAHGFDVHTPWQDLTDDQRDVILFGTTALKVPFGKHSLESRMKWEGITARPRETGYYRGLVPVVTEILSRGRNPSIARFVRSVPCSVCHGTRLGRAGREARLGPWTLPDVCALPLRDLEDFDPGGPVWEAVRPSFRARLRRLCALQLGHLSLARGSTTLSGGEAQRVRLATQVAASLSGFLYAFDEPTLGLHPSAQAGMRGVLDELVEAGNTVLVVEHDPDMVRHADRLVAIGPGAGPHGGRVTYDGPPPADPLGTVPRTRTPRAPTGWLQLRGAHLHNLDDVDVDLPLGAFTVVSGPSGAGKTSLVFGTLLPALRGEPAAVAPLAPQPVQVVDAKPIGRTSRSTPATWTGLFDLIRKRFAATPEARARGFKAGRFSYNNKAGRCPACEGLGVQRVGLHLMADVELPCPVCEGRRYAPDTLEVRDRGHTVADVLAMSVDEARGVYADDPPIAALLDALSSLGLGYLPLGRSSATLSRGEAQRIKLATLLGTVSAPGIVLLDEPDRGLHPTDIARLLRGLHALVDAGHTVVAVSHHRHVWAAADHRIALNDGRVVAPPAIAAVAPRPPRAPVPRPSHIRLRGVRTHNLHDVDVDVPHGALTVVCGVSGSGKSSLVFDTLGAEGWHRFAESLPFHVRRSVRRLPRPELDAATGLGPTLALRQEPPRTGPRATVGTFTEIDATLRLLWSRCGSVDGNPTTLTAGHFSPNRPLGACPTCEGRGEVLRCDPALLVTDPSRALGDGALAGTHAGRFFTEPGGQHLATLQAVLPDTDLDQPWEVLPESVREVALYGADTQVSVTWAFERGDRAGTHSFEGRWEGLCALVEREARRRARSKSAAKWADTLVPRACDTCGGTKLRPEVRAVEVDGLRLPTLRVRPLDGLLDGLGDGPVRRPLLDEIRPRLEALVSLGLGHLTLDRPLASLSSGELQRVRLATLLRAGLSGLTLLLDEPGGGLDDDAVAALADRLRGWVADGHTVVVVSHRAPMIRAADHLIELGPGAGEAGGRILAEGDAVLDGDGPTAVALRQGEVASAPQVAEALEAGLTVVTGPSGSGKTRWLAAHAGLGVDALGQTPLDALGLMPALQKLFHRAGSPVPKRALSFRSPAGRCPDCKGTGVETVSMDYLADLALPCPTCGGTRYRPEVLALRWEGMHVAEFLDTPVAGLPELPRTFAAVAAMLELGLGHLSLGRRRQTLSGGERQRLVVAAALAKGADAVRLDEPTRGLHEADVAVLIGAIRRLTATGARVLAADTRPSLLAAADGVVVLGGQARLSF